ncbi:hypothetical protein TrLO_g15085 [Triparma laevis f. longispina]|uniref:Uncharacterized protein n=1 Tax=Triparma laevis f. longispina TaxID=1714387 RepID=A0A9W7E4Y1_9STRA|nr:hypothetical protein TrLO_g15085 [Triparma laevis f. longispina]
MFVAGIFMMLGMVGAGADTPIVGLIVPVMIIPIFCFIMNQKKKLTVAIENLFLPYQSKGYFTNVKYCTGSKHRAPVLTLAVNQTVHAKMQQQQVQGRII